MEIKKIALLIDAENIDSSKIPIIYKELSSLGKIQTSRAYADWSSVSMNWLNQIKNYSISPIQQLHTSSLKNAADIALTIDAMDLLYSSKYEIIAIASSDSDYGKLITRIKDSGVTTIGFGEKKTPNPLVISFDKFFFLDEENDSKGTQQNQNILNILTDLSHNKKYADSAGWINVGIAGSHLKMQINDFSPQKYGFKTFGKFLENFPSLIELRHKGRSLEYRMKK